MTLNLKRWPLMPSGIQPGDALSLPLRESLARHARVPPMYQPVIEDGNYNEFKDCAFRVCAIRVCEVALEDIEAECKSKGVLVRAQLRRWQYAPEHECATSVEMVMEVERGTQMADELQEFLHYLSRKYGFHYNRCVVNSYRAIPRMIGRGSEHGYYSDTDSSRIQVELQIVWDQWM